MIVVFTLHKIQPVLQDEEDRFITITPEGFRGVIRQLRWVGYDIVSLKDAVEHPEWQRDKLKRAILTFDDGYADFLPDGLAVVEQEKCPVTIFVLGGRIGGTNEWDKGHLPLEQQDRLMTYEEMATAARSGWVRFASHGMMHRKFPELSMSELEAELHESYQKLNHDLGSAFVPVLAYPYGHYTEQVTEVMKSTPYLGAFTVKKGHWSPSAKPFEIPRYDIYFHDRHPFVFFGKLIRNGLLV